MHATDIIGWTADADVWCDSCATDAYGPEPETQDRRDYEGNPVHPIFADNESDLLADTDRVSCNRCHTTLAEWCDICEDPNHATSDHGEPIIMFEHGRRDEWANVGDRLSSAMVLVDRDAARLVNPSTAFDYGQAYRELRTIRAELDRWIHRREWLESAFSRCTWNQETPESCTDRRAKADADTNQVNHYRCHFHETDRADTIETILDDEGVPEWFTDALDSINTALGDAGFLAYDDGDAGCWFVYGPLKGDG